MKEYYMNTKDCYVKMWRNFARFTGRATRAEYWYAFLAHLIIAFALGVLARAGGLFVTAGGLYALVCAMPFIALSVRRLHDVGKSGKLWLAVTALAVLSQVCLVAGFVSFTAALLGLGGAFSIAAALTALYLIIQCGRKGTPGENQYGPDPRGASEI